MSPFLNDCIVGDPQFVPRAVARKPEAGFGPPGKIVPAAVVVVASFFPQHFHVRLEQGFSGPVVRPEAARYVAKKSFALIGLSSPINFRMVGHDLREDMTSPILEAPVGFSF